MTQYPVYEPCDFLRPHEIAYLRLAGMRIGDNVQISRGAKFVTADVEIGANCRIDHGVLLTGHIRLGKHVHIGAYSCLFGSEGLIRIGNFTGISPRATLLTGSESLEGLQGGPATPYPLRALTVLGDVTIGENCAVFAHTLVLPGSSMDEGAVLGGNSMLNGKIPAYEIWAGSPARFRKDRTLISAQTLKDAT
jgi:galactoside O-acetyltransferase